MKNFLLQLFKNYKHSLILIYFIVIYYWFTSLEKSIIPQYYLYSVMDDYIPFIKEFVIFYIAWFAYIAIVMTYLGLRSPRDFIKLSIFMFAGMSICYTIYMILPNGNMLRPDIVSDDWLSKIVKNIYLTDTPTNCAPSIHVLVAIAVHISFVNCARLKERKFIKAVSFIFMILTATSTVFVKQHSILDGLYSLVLVGVLYLLIYKVKYKEVFGIFKKVEVEDASEI